MTASVTCLTATMGRLCQIQKAILTLGDGDVTSMDASEVLSFYSVCATGKYTNDEDGLEKYQNDKAVNGGCEN